MYSNIVILLAIFWGVTPDQCLCERGVSSDIGGFHFEMLLAHLAELESRIEKQLTVRMAELERNVIDACGLKVVDAVNDQTNQLRYMMNHPAAFREGGWTVAQRRFDGSLDFYRNWTEYKQGFGDSRGEFWIGLEKLYQFIRTGQHELLVVLEDFDGAIAHAHYSDFRVGNEREKYALKALGDYSGTAGDSLRLHERKPFSTYDANASGLSGVSCASEHHGAWWFLTNGECVYSHLNGNYSQKASVAYEMGVHWHDFRGDRYSLKSCKMMIRRRT